VWPAAVVAVGGEAPRSLPPLPAGIWTPRGPIWAPGAWPWTPGGPNAANTAASTAET